MRPPDTQKLPTLPRRLSSQPSPTLHRFLNCLVTGQVREPMYWYRVGSVIVCRTALFLPNFLRTGRGGSKPPGSPGWRPLPGAKAFGLQQPTGYHLFTIHSYLLPSPTQVGDAGRVRELTYSYKLRNVTVCGTALPAPGFLHVSSRAG